MKKKLFKTLIISLVVMNVYWQMNNTVVYAGIENMTLEEELLETLEFNITQVNKTIRVNDIVKLRSGPDTTYDSIADLDKGSTFFAMGITDNEWYQITYEGQIGYIRADLVEIEESDTALIAEMEENIKSHEEAIEAEIQEQVQAQILADEQAAEQKHQEEVKAREKEEARLAAERTNRNFAILIASLLLVAFASGLLLLIKGIKNGAASDGDILSSDLQNEKGNTEIEEDGLDIVSLDDKKK